MITLQKSDPQKTYTYEPSTQLLTSVENLDQNLTVTVKINLKNETIQYNNDAPTLIADSEYYIFLDFMKNIEATPQLMDALLKNTYYTKQFLKTKLGRFSTPKENNYLQYFPSFVLPYEALYRELVLKPKYAKKLLETYDKNNNAFIRRLKQITRKVLIVPGIFISPFIIISVGLILKNQS